MEEQAVEIRTALQALGRRGIRQKIPDEIRELVCLYGVGRRKEKASWRKIALEIGVSAESIRRFTGERAVASRVPAFIPVEVRDPARVPHFHRDLVLVSPLGFRLEGLSLAAAADILRLLG